MYLPVPIQPSCARAWVKAAEAVIEAGGEGYNVVIDVENPAVHDAADNQVIGLVDSFLRRHNVVPISTVSNTLFPQAMYRIHGAPALYSEYHKFHDKLTKSKRWGRYFMRMIRKIDSKGQPYNPLVTIIDKLKKQGGSNSSFKAAYELPIYDPARDRKKYRDLPCLSHLSFKLHPELGLTLTAMYRNQTYITRCLGNLIGLGRLQAFVAQEAGLERVGPLTCISTHAELDTGTGWGIKDARRLVEDAAATLVDRPVAGIST